MSGVDAIKTFYKSCKSLFNNDPRRRVGVEAWFKHGREALDALESKTAKSADIASLKKATEEWKQLSDRLKALLAFDQDPHIPGFIERACTVWWDSVTERQIGLNCEAGNAYRAMAAYIAAQLAFRRRDRGTALRWASLGYLADKLDGLDYPGGNEVMLLFGLAVPVEAKDALDQQVSHLNSGVERLPEWLLAEALDESNAISLIAPSERYSHHLSAPFVKAAIAHVFSAADDSDTQGQRLEKFAAYLVSTIPGMLPQRGFVAIGQSGQHDVLATVLGNTPYPMPERAAEWLIECKNWKRPISAEKAAHFLAKMQHSGAKFGIIITNASVTGKAGRKTSKGMRNAALFLREFAMRERIVCLDIDANDLKQLGNGETFRSLIDKKYQEFRFGHRPLRVPVSSSSF